MATDNGRTAEQVRLDIEAEREGLAAALEDVRAGMDVNARLKGKMPAAAAGALALGFVAAGGIQATVRLLKGPSQEDRTKRFGPFSLASATSGRAPGSPLRLSWREWRTAFVRAGKQFIADDCMGLAQQVAFSALLAFLPTVVLLIGLLGLFGTGAFNEVEHFVDSVAPSGVTDVIELAKKDAADNKQGSAIAFTVGTIVALWAASGAMGAVIKAVNRAYDRIETRPFWKLRLIAIVLVIATGLTTAGVFLLIVFGGTLGDALVRRTELGDEFKLFWDIARWPIAFLAVLFFFAFVYYLAPNIKHRGWRWLSAGSLVGSAIWLVLSGLFALYTSFAGSYARTYGSIAGAIVLLLWLNYSSWAILFGAELNAELERQANIHAAGGPKAGLVRQARR